MKLMYANLLGTWTLLTNESTLTIDGSHTDVSTWIEEMLPSMNSYPYLNIEFQGKNYRIHPSMIQIVTE